LSYRSPSHRLPHYLAKAGLLAAVVTLALAALLGGCRPADHSGGGAAPDFTLPDLAGNQVSLASLRGKPIVLNFWGTT